MLEILLADANGPCSTHGVHLSLYSLATTSTPPWRATATWHVWYPKSIPTTDIAPYIYTAMCLVYWAWTLLADLFNRNTDLSRKGVQVPRMRILKYPM